jgi:hypothetical protein
LVGDTISLQKLGDWPSKNLKDADVISYRSLFELLLRKRGLSSDELFQK